jgi:probable aminopeptidase NPEPL1
LHYILGIWGVGKAAENLPALAVLSFTPPSAEKTVAWVGKGIVFDTGGLCIKTKVKILSVGNNYKIYTKY